MRRQPVMQLRLFGDITELATQVNKLENKRQLLSKSVIVAVILVKMSSIQGKTYYKTYFIRDYLKESQEAESSHENITRRSKTLLVGKRKLANSPIIVISDSDDDAEPETVHGNFEKNPNYAQLIENKTDSNKRMRRSSSFDSLLHSRRIAASVSNSNSKNGTQSTLESNNNENESNFEDLMNSPLLTPSQNENDDKTSKIKDSNTQSTKETSFEELMNCIFSPSNIESSSQIGNNNKKLNLNDSEETNTQDTEKPDKENEGKKSFEKFLNALLSPNIPNFGRTRNDKARNCFKEIGTQTSTDDGMFELLTPSSSQNKEGKQKKMFNSQTDDVIMTETETRLTPIAQTDRTNIISDNLSYFDSPILSQSQSFAYNTRQSQSLQINQDHDKDINLLRILARDVTMPLNKIKFHNIAKIGTEKWLESAQNAISENMIQIQETFTENIPNTFDDLLSDSSVKQKVNCYYEENIRIYRIENVEGDNCEQAHFSQSILALENLETCSQTERKLRIEMNEIFKDQNLLRIVESPRIDKNKIKNTINDIFVKLYSVYENGKIPRFTSLTTYRYKHCVFKDRRLQLQLKKKAPRKSSKMRNIREYMRFCRVLYAMGKIYALLETNNQLTKREIFYQAKHLLKNQNQINTAIQQITNLLNVGQWHLNIISNSGLVYGNLKLVWSSSEVTNCNVPATLIPSNADDIVEFRTNAYFILVVEKESIFQKLLQEDLPNKLARPFIMITGKGFPNFSTQLFLKKLVTVLALPVFILVDADIHGIRIMLTYRFGSCTSCHLSQYLAVPNARWLGVLPSEISSLGIKNLPLTNSEKASINTLLKYPYMESHPKIQEEVQFLLSSNKKASIEGLIKTDTFLTEFYLPSKFNNRDFV